MEDPLLNLVRTLQIFYRKYDLSTEAGLVRARRSETGLSSVCMMSMDEIAGHIERSHVKHPKKSEIVKALRAEYPRKRFRSKPGKIGIRSPDVSRLMLLHSLGFQLRDLCIFFPREVEILSISGQSEETPDSSEDEDIFHSEEPLPLIWPNTRDKNFLFQLNIHDWNPELVTLLLESNRVVLITQELCYCLLLDPKDRLVELMINWLTRYAYPYQHDEIMLPLKQEKFSEMNSSANAPRVPHGIGHGNHTRYIKALLNFLGAVCPIFPQLSTCEVELKLMGVPISDPRLEHSPGSDPRLEHSPGSDPRLEVISGIIPADIMRPTPEFIHLVRSAFSDPDSPTIDGTPVFGTPFRIAEEFFCDLGTNEPTTDFHDRPIDGPYIPRIDEDIIDTNHIEYYVWHNRQIMTTSDHEFTINVGKANYGNYLYYTIRSRKWESNGHEMNRFSVGGILHDNMITRGLLEECVLKQNSLSRFYSLLMTLRRLHD